MSRNPIGERSAAYDLGDVLSRRLERRLRRIDRLAAGDAPLIAEPDRERSLQALSERITRLRIQAELLSFRSGA